MPPGILRYADVLIIVLAAPFALLMGAPALGVLGGVAGWILQSAAAEFAERRAARETDTARALTIGLVSSLTRVFLLALMIVAVRKAGSRDDGLAIAVVFLVAFTLHLAMNLLLRAPARRAPTA